MAGEALSLALAGDETALAEARRAVEHGERSGNPSALGMALFSLVAAHPFIGGDPIETSLHRDRATTLAESVRNEWLLGMCVGLPLSTLHHDDPAAQLAVTLDTVQDFHRSGWTTHAWSACWLIPELLLDLDQSRAAATWLGACSASKLPRFSQEPLPALLADLLHGISTPELIEAFERGTTTPLPALCDDLERGH